MHNTRSNYHLIGKQDFNRDLAADSVFNRSDSLPSRRAAHYDGFSRQQFVEETQTRRHGHNDGGRRI